MNPRPSWHALFAPLAADGGTAMRVVHVVLDGDGRPISASDMVFYRTGPAEIRQESVGGRFEADGSFRGTRWLTAGPEPADDEPPDWESTPSEPSAADIAALRALVDEMLRRASGE